MPLMDSGAVRELLGDDRLHDIWEIVHGGLEDYQSEYSEKSRLIHCSNTRASIIHDHHIARASSFARKHSVTGTEIHEFSGLHILMVDGKLAIRFKKLDYQKKSSNQPTKQVLNYLNQGTIEELPNIVNLEAGYILSPDNELEDISLVCPNGAVMPPYWEIQLTKDAAKTVVKDLFDESEDDSDAVEFVPKQPDNVVELKTKKEKDGN